MKIGRGETSSCAAPRLDVWTSVGEDLVDVVALSYQIRDVSGEAPVVRFPGAGGFAEVDVGACPDGDRLALGHYVARWTVGDGEPLGSHEIVWKAQIAEGAEIVQWSEEFEVVAGEGAGDSSGYATVADLRAEGVSLAMASDLRLEALIDEASREIDGYCRQFFSARLRTLKLDGTGTDTLYMPAPVIRLDSVAIAGVDFSESALAALLVYGGAPKAEPRRESSRIVRETGRWTKGKRNVEVVALLGYTEDDGTESGRVPRAIRRACTLLALKRVAPLVEGDDPRVAHRMTDIRNKQQSVSLAKVRPDEAPYTGDPEIDSILLRYTAAKIPRAV